MGEFILGIGSIHQMPGEPLPHMFEKGALSILYYSCTVILLEKIVLLFSLFLSSLSFLCAFLYIRVTRLDTTLIGLSLSFLSYSFSHNLKTPVCRIQGAEALSVIELSGARSKIPIESWHLIG